jgi:hypothetical protein
VRPGAWLLALSSAGMLAGCASPDRVVFVTGTQIDIGYDASLGNVNIGYDRNELVIGPAYPETGGVPPVYARIGSDLGILQATIKQLYATGDAATLATSPTVQPAPPAPTVPPVLEKPLAGKRRLMVFGTATHFGLKAHFVGEAPDSISLGYKRKEFSVLPLQVADPTSTPDKYGSVLAGLSLNSNVRTATGTVVGLSQVIATGSAAENLARDSGVRQLFIQETRDALAEAAVMAVPVAVRADQALIKPICDKQLARGGSPTLNAEMTKIETNLRSKYGAGFSIGGFCAAASVDPEQFVTIDGAMRGAGLLP